MQANELRQKSVQDLQQELVALRREQFNLRMQVGSGQGTRPDQFGKVRKSIARVKTVINEKLAAEKANAVSE